YLRARYDVAGRVTALASVLAVVMLLSLTVAVLASGWLQRVITEPLDSIASVARGIVEKRDYSLRVRQTSPDEIGLVIGAFNNMLDEVQARARALQESNVALQRTEQALREADRRK